MAHSISPYEVKSFQKGVVQLMSQGRMDEAKVLRDHVLYRGSNFSINRDRYELQIVGVPTSIDNYCHSLYSWKE